MKNSKLQKQLRRISQTAKPFLIALAFAPWGVLLYFSVTSYTATLARDDTYLMMNFVELFGGVYGLFMVIVLLKTWLYFENVDYRFSREIAALRNLMFLLRGGTAKATISILTGIERYCIHVIEHAPEEWSNEKYQREGDYLLSDMRLKINKLSSRGKTNHQAIELVNAVNEVFSERQERLIESGHETPRSVWFLAISSSILWLLPFYTLTFSNAYLGIFAVGGVTFVIVFLLILIQDLNDPFHGSWSIRLERWNDTYDETSKLLESMYGDNRESLKSKAG